MKQGITVLDSRPPKTILVVLPLCDLRQLLLGGPQTLMYSARGETTLEKMQVSARQTPKLGLEILCEWRHMAEHPLLARTTASKSEFSLAVTLPVGTAE